MEADVLPTKRTVVFVGALSAFYAIPGECRVSRFGGREPFLQVLTRECGYMER